MGICNDYQLLEPEKGSFTDQRKMRREMMEIQIGDVLQLKKPHPCGSKEWEVLRVGADFRLKCLGCGHQIMIARRLLEKNIKEIKEKA